MTEWMTEWTNDAGGAQFEQSSGGRQIAVGSVTEQQQDDAELRSLPQERLHDRLQRLHTRYERLTASISAILTTATRFLSTYM